MDKKQFDKLRMTTQMNEMVHVIKTSPYKSTKDQATATLAAIQEEYKAKFGEYSEAHKIAEEKVNEVYSDPRKKGPDGKIEFAKLPIGELIKRLQAIEAKSPDGKTEIWVNGTLMTPDGGNTVIMSNEPQM